MAKLPRGVTNRNPGNIDYNPANDWVGQLPHNPAIESRFCRFDTPVNGIRAMSILLQTYQRKHGLDTVRKIVSRWAPGNENDTESYIRTVCRMIGVDDDEAINVKDYATARALIVAKIKVECAGYTYPDDVVDEGLRRAGVTKGKSTAPVKTAATAVVAVAAEKLIENVPQAQAAVDALGMPWLSAALTGVSIAAGIYVAVHAMRRMSVEA